MGVLGIVDNSANKGVQLLCGNYNWAKIWVDNGLLPIYQEQVSQNCSRDWLILAIFFFYIYMSQKSSAGWTIMVILVIWSCDFWGFNLPKTHPKLIILSINCISINFQKYLLCITTYIEILIVYRDIIKYTVIEDFIHITCPWMYCESWIWCKLCFCGPIRIFHIDNHH